MLIDANAFEKWKDGNRKKHEREQREKENRVTCGDKCSDCWSRLLKSLFSTCCCYNENDELGGNGKNRNANKPRPSQLLLNQLNKGRASMADFQVFFALKS